jgi:UDP-glucose 4-epimerase
LRRGEKVRVLDNFSSGKRENIAPFLDAIELVEGDIRSYHIVREAVEGIDVILHQAALPSVTRSVQDPITSNEVNVTGTLNVLNAAKDAKVKRIVFASSSSVYGDNPELPKHERMIPNPLSPYAVSKLAGEKYCGVFSKIYGLETISLRYFNVFGPRQDPNSQYSAVIPRFIKAMLNEISPTIYGDGEQSRDFTFVDNVVHANLIAIEAGQVSGLAMNCACNERITLNQLVASINEILGKKIAPIFVDNRIGDIKHSFASIDLAKKSISYEPKVKFLEGLNRTVKWYQSGI